VFWRPMNFLLSFATLLLVASLASPLVDDDYDASAMQYSYHTLIEHSNQAYLDSLDVRTPSALNALVRKTHQHFIATQSEQSPANTRPIYANPAVVNEAYRIYNNKPSSYKVCKDDISEAIFSTPPGCMTRIMPGNLPIHVGIKRTLVKRAGPCLYTSIRCMSRAQFSQSAIQLIKAIKAEQHDRRFGSEFWYQRKLYASAEVVNEAYRIWIGEDVPDDVCYGSTDDDDIDVSIGALLVVFPQNPECKKKKTAGRGGHCRNIKVECLSK